MKVGDIVASRVDAQGMVRGQLYEVTAVRERRTFAGGFTNVDLVDEYGKEVKDVGNVHLVLDVRVEACMVERHLDRE